MVEDNPLRRRAVLAGIGTATSVIAITTGAAGQDRDPGAYDRPRTEVVNGIEFTLWDCTRVIVDTDRTDLYEVQVQVEYIAEYWREELDTTTHMEAVTAEYYGEELDINTHRRVPIEGAYAGADRLSWPMILSVTAFGHGEEELARIDWPTEEWDCREMIEETVGDV